MFCCSAVKSTKMDCEEYFGIEITSNEYLGLFKSHPSLIEAYRLRNKSTLSCFDFIIQLMAVSNDDENTSLPVNKQEKRENTRRSQRVQDGRKTQLPRKPILVI